MDIADIIGMMSDDHAPKKGGSALIAETFRSELLDFVGTLEKEVDPDEEVSLIRASGLYKLCTRREALYALNPELTVLDKVPIGLRLTFDIGTSIHYWWQNKYLGPMGRLWGHWYCAKCDMVTVTGLMPKRCHACKKGRTRWVEQINSDGEVVRGKVDNITYVEMSLKCEELGYSGHPDGILIAPEMGGSPQYLLEIKSIASSGYDKLKGPLNDHLIQMHAYMRLLNIREGILIYVDKGKQAEWVREGGRLTPKEPRVRIYHIEYDEGFWAKTEKVVREFWDLREKVRTEALTLPIAGSYTRVCDSPSAKLAQDCGACLTCFSMRSR
jgi:hypothetical protein